MRKQVHKGFTLLELIIVMALFSVVMYGVVQFLNPVSKFFVRSSKFETTTACVDNMRRAIEGNLKYADRVHAYSGDKTTISTNVDKFWKEYFQGRKLMDCRGMIYVMAFDNDCTNGLKSFQLGQNYSYSDSDGASGTHTMNELSDFSKYAHNNGKITLYTYRFDNDQCILADTQDWYVNQKMYGEYNYYFSLGSGTDFSVDDPTVFNPSDCTIAIDVREMERDGNTYKEHTYANDEERANQLKMASFSMKNVLDATKKYSSPMMDYKIIVNEDAGNDKYKVFTEEGSKGFAKLPYLVEGTKLKLTSKVENPGTDKEKTVWSSEITGTPVGHSRYHTLEVEGTDDFFYFVFTQAETIYDAGERVYETTAGLPTNDLAQDGSFVKPDNPAVDTEYDDTYLDDVKKAYLP